VNPDTTNPKPARWWRPVVRAVGSLWVAAVLLVLLLVAMACATVFESEHGTQQALAAFYMSWWFELLLWLVAISVLVATALRFPFAKRQTGFVLTHAAVLLILAGALITQYWGVDGQVALAEGQTAGHFFNVHRDSLAIVRRSDQARAEVDLGGSWFDQLFGSAIGGFKAVKGPKVPVLSLGDVRVEIKEYLPDGRWEHSVVNENPTPRPAVEVSLSGANRPDPVWVFADRGTQLGSMDVAFRVVEDADEWASLISDKPPSRAASDGIVKMEYEGLSYQVSLSNCLGKAVPVGETDLTVEVLRYLPHAMVGSDKKLTNQSDRPQNPAIEVEITGPAGKEKRYAFSKMPGFGHRKNLIEGLKLVFVAPAATASAPIEVVSNPNGDHYVRFSPEDGDMSTRDLTVGEPVESPWDGRQFTVLRRFDHARVDRRFVPVDPVREDRTPAVLVAIGTTQHTRQTWLQKNARRPHTETIGGTRYDLTYAEKSVPFGFDLTLDRFRIGRYPGGMRPRSFESYITINDPAGGGAQSSVISMNHPVKYGGYTFYQSSYRQGAGQTFSFLGVSRDPGRPVVFTGYIMMLVGMIVVLGTRIKEHRKPAPSSFVRNAESEITNPQPQTPKREMVHT